MFVAAFIDYILQPFRCRDNEVTNNLTPAQRSAAGSILWHSAQAANKRKQEADPAGYSREMRVVARRALAARYGDWPEKNPLRGSAD